MPYQERRRPVSLRELYIQVGLTLVFTGIAASAWGFWEQRALDLAYAATISDAKSTADKSGRIYDPNAVLKEFNGTHKNQRVKSGLLGGVGLVGVVTGGSMLRLPPTHQRYINPKVFRRYPFRDHRNRKNPHK